LAFGTLRLMKSRIMRAIARLRALPIQSFYTLSGWRFGDLKQYIDVAVGREADATLAMLESESVLKTAERARVAVVTCLPPDESGIANFSAKHLPLAGAPVDVYSQVRDVGLFLRSRVVFERQSAGMAKLYPMSSMLARDAAGQYDKIVCVLGNSGHNIETFRLLEAISSLGSADRIVCYLHDPCCHNVVQLAKQLEAADYLAYLSDIYSTELAAGGGIENWQAHKIAVDAGILGVRAIAALGVRHFMVNSLAASSLIRNDLPSELREQTTVDVLFHPVFPPEVTQADAEKGNSVTIGSFGAAAYSKGTDVVLDAVRRLRTKGVPARLVLAGYLAKRFVEQTLPSDDRSWVEVAEPKTERDLQLDMLKCDIAVQLRRGNLGESSGVVPTLIGLGIPTVVSPVGAFTEYGNAVATFDGYDADRLAELLAAGITVSRDGMASYAERHTVSEFNSRLLQVLSDPGRPESAPQKAIDRVSYPVRPPVTSG
jgi:glycosyltransferase involved in cell wall biosynthesis